MAEIGGKRIDRRWWSGLVISAGGLVGSVVATAAAQQPMPATSPTAQTSPPAAPATAPESESEYITRPVAFIGRDIVITREELGEFLVLRRGSEKVDMLVDRRIVDVACREAGVEVTAAEVETSLANDLKGFGGISQKDFVKQVLQRYGKNLIEWKEDVIRPKLMLSKLCQAHVHVTESDLREAFEARYGEKIECRIIQWPTRQDAEAVYFKIRDNEQEFSEAAKHQKVGPLAASGGKIKPLSHHLATYNPAFKDKVDNDHLEQEAFRLHPGEVSSLLTIPGGCMVIKCDKRLPADPSVNPAAIHDELVKEITERKSLEEIPKLLKELRDKAKPTIPPGSAPGNAHTPYTPGSTRGRVVAYIYGNMPVTREDLGEYLITRYGAENLDLLVNKRIIEEECKAKGVIVDTADIEIALEEKIASVGGKDRFNTLLRANHTSLAQYKEDVLRPQLALGKLSAGRIKVSDEDLKAAFEAYHGEKIECRIILWPRDQRKHAMDHYAELRDSEKAFAEKASTQESQALASTGGKLMDGQQPRQITRHTLGNPELERELFSLQPGEVSRLIETPEGIVIAKCDKRIPADTSASLANERPRLTKEVTERRVQLEIPKLFAELRKSAEPRLLLKDPNRPQDLKAEVEHDLDDSVPTPHKGKGRAPAGN